MIKWNIFVLIYTNIAIYEDSKEWQTKYNNCINKNKIKRILIGNCDWKYEYGRINSYNKWELFSEVNSEILDIYNNQINKIPKEIEHFIILRALDLSKNQIKKVPKKIGKLINLQELYLSDNQIKKVSKEIAQLINLNSWILIIIK